jgi:two-component system, OmpR family, sensor kinase
MSGAFLLLMVCAAGVGCAAAIVAEVAARTVDELRWSWVAAGLALYGAIVLPIDVLAATTVPHLLVVGLVAQVGAVALLAVALRPPAGARAVPWSLAAAALGVASLAVPGGVPPGGGTPAGLAMAVAWLAVAAGHAVDGLRSRSATRLHTGLGLLLVGIAELTYLVTAPTAPLPAALALAGLLVVLLALARCLVRSTADERALQWTLQEELAALGLQAQQARERAAERDHELRNGLAALVGITHLLRADADRDEQEHLRAAALSEMGRLHAMLKRDDVDRRRQRAYPVEPIVAGLAALRRSVGHPVTVTADPELRACGDPAVLAQVITNLFANCDRHAPGAPVAVRAYRSEDHAVVELRDEGPGLRTALEHDLLRRDVHDPPGSRSGIGLHISARLLEREGGQLDLRTVADPRGCLVTVRVTASDLAHPGPAVETRPPDRHMSALRALLRWG